MKSSMFCSKRRTRKTSVILGDIGLHIHIYCVCCTYVDRIISKPAYGNMLGGAPPLIDLLKLSESWPCDNYATYVYLE